MVRSPYEWNILEWDDKPQRNKQLRSNKNKSTLTTDTSQHEDILRLKDRKGNKEKERGGILCEGFSTGERYYII